MKKQFSLPSFALAAVALLLVAGCSSPETRIKENPEIFARLSVEQQEMIKRGQIGLGFDAEMVKLALGDPDRVRTRTDAEGTGDVWSYVTYEGPDGAMLYRGWYHRNYWGGRRHYYPYYMDYPARREREHFRVAFREGKVVSIEQETNR